MYRKADKYCSSFFFNWCSTYQLFLLLQDPHIYPQRTSLSYYMNKNNYNLSLLLKKPSNCCTEPQILRHDILRLIDCDQLHSAL